MASRTVATTRTAAEIPCCVCGTMILPNSANQCGTCLAQEFDLKSIVQRGPSGASEIIIHQCRECRRFERSEKIHEFAEPESPELLALCLKRIPALTASAVPKLHLVDAMWVWTEPHSMRWKLRLTVRTEIQNVMIQQRVLVQLVQKFKQCCDCNREFSNRTWHAIVQLRQKRTDDAPRKGLVMLEMALARNPEIRKHVLKVDTCSQGFDFYFFFSLHAQTLASYLARVAPMRIKMSKKLVSTDVKNNTANMKHTVACDMVPLCRDDLVAVHKSAKGTLSGRMCLVKKVSSVVHLVDASPKRSTLTDNATAELSPETYYKAGGEKVYRVVSSSRRMVRFVVLDVELCQDERGEHGTYSGPKSGDGKYALADVEVARESDFGHNDETFRCVTHLGNLIQVGDVVLGYDLASSVLSGDDEWLMENGFNSTFVMPDVVLVKKVQGVEKDAEKEKERAKSSGSKKRERRRQKDEKKMRELEEVAARMGFLENGELDRKRFEMELLDDPDLEEDLIAAERELLAFEAPSDATDDIASEVIEDDKA